jgi:hypothetical protein
MSAVMTSDAAAFARLTNFAWKYERMVRDGSSRKGFVIEPPAALGGEIYKVYQLQLSEYRELVDILTSGKDEFIFEPFLMQKSDYSLRIYQRPSGPGAPKLVFMLGGAALPDTVRKLEKQLGEAYLVDDAYRELSPFASTEENGELLRKYRLEIPRDLSWYE